MTIRIPGRWAAGTHERISKQLARCALFEFPASASGTRSPLFFAWTDWPHPIPYKETGVANGTAFEFRPGFAPFFSALRKERHMRPHTVEIRAPLAINESDGLVLDDFTSGIIRGSRVTHWVVDPLRPNVKSPFRDRFFLDEPEFRENEYVLPMVSARERLRRLRGDVATPSCRRELGDLGCGVPLDGVLFPQFRITDATAVPSSVLSHNRISTRLQFTDATATASTYWTQANWFAHGELLGKISSGDNRNRGFSKKVAVSGVAFNPNVSDTTLWAIDIELMEPMPYNIQTGDLFDLVVGCDKLYTTCQDKFPIESITDPVTMASIPIGNRRRFLGEPFIAGTDRIIRSADAT